MVQISFAKACVAVLRNQVRGIAGGAVRGGHRIATWSEADRRRHAQEIFDTLSPHWGALDGKVGVEVGPGDNLEVCRLCLEAGCRRMYAVERFTHASEDIEGVELVRSTIESAALPEPADFAYSNDVFEHVDDVPGAMRAIFHVLRPGGLFVNSVDLRGHNVFGGAAPPLDFLTCPDWLWRLMFSNLVTTNRVRVHEFVDAAEAAGFEVRRCEPLAMADSAYMERVRTHMLPRYRSLPDEDLRVLQLLLVLRKPG